MHRRAIGPSLLIPALLLTLGGVAMGGPLTPPAGPVASSMKPLSEVEPRIAVSAANTPGDGANLFRITQPGSYYLTGNVAGVAGKNGISIEADCAHGRLVGPVFLDAQGRFSAEGTYAFEGGPTPVGGFPAEKVTASAASASP